MGFFTTGRWRYYLADRVIPDMLIVWRLLFSGRCRCGCRWWLFMRFLFYRILRSLRAVHGSFSAFPFGYCPASFLRCCWGGRGCRQPFRIIKIFRTVHGHFSTRPDACRPAFSRTRFLRGGCCGGAHCCGGRLLRWCGVFRRDGRSRLPGIVLTG